MSSFSWPSTGNGAGITAYANFASLPSTATNGEVAVTVDTDTIYVYNLGTLTWLPVASPGAVLSIGSPANGLSITTNKLSIALSSASLTGALSSTDWSTFNSKQAAGNYITALTSDVSATGPGSVPATVNSVGGSTAANINIATVLVNTVQSGNKFLGSPANGSSAAPTFRTLVLADIPSLSTVYLPLAGGTMSGAINMGSNKVTSVTDPTAAQDAATKNYVDTMLAALNPADAVYASTTANLSGTYLNGVAGVGATFTITATGAFTVDGTTPPALSRILIKNQSSGFQNGIYDLTIAGTTGVSPVFTRSLDYNTASEMNSAGLVPVINGTTNALSSWQQTATITTVGTDSLVFQEFTANPSLYLLKANNLNDVANATTSFNNISGMTSTGDMIYGGASGTRTRLAAGSNTNVLTLAAGVPTWAAPATSGTVTSVAMTVPTFLSIAGSPITSSGTLALTLSGTALPIANGGTAVTSVTTAPAATTFAGWDANSNLSAFNHIEGYATTATAAGTTTLVVGSKYQQYFTGSTTQTVLLPVASTLVLGQQFQVINNSSGVVTVQSSGANTIQAMAANTTLIITCVLTSGTGTASWNAFYGIGTIAAAVNPTIQKFTSGSGTYTTPTGVQWIRVRALGGGGGGGSSGTTNGTASVSGGNTTFGTSLISAVGGTGGTRGGDGGAGGTASLGSGPIGTALSGAQGSGGGSIALGAFVPTAGAGGNSAFGGGGAAGGQTSGTGGNGTTNTGGGGGGGTGNSSSNVVTGAGGGAGGFIDGIISSPLSSYAYQIGSGGAGQLAGTNGSAGGAGGSGYIEVTEYYTSFSVSLSTSVSANTVLAGPSSGSAATPTFRNLAISDLPSLIQNTTTTANILSTSTYITADTSGSSYIDTFPVPTGNSGQSFFITKTTTDINILTLAIATSGSFIENGTTTSTTTLNTAGESLQIISNGTNYLVQRRDIPSTYAAYTPTFTGWGTVSAVNFVSWREGGMLRILGTFTGGTSTATEARATLGYSGSSANVTSISTLPTLQKVGEFSASALTQPGSIAIEASKTYMVFDRTNILTKASGNDFANNDTISINATFPIVGWNR